MTRGVTRSEMVALWALADVALVTSLREGVNLGAMEFVACQQTSMHGVLVYRWGKANARYDSMSPISRATCVVLRLLYVYLADILWYL